MFMVKYVDDFKKKHLVIANTLNELRFIQERFEVVDYEPIVK
jgi:hypothetical protein